MRPITEAEIIAGLEVIAAQDWGVPPPINIPTKPSTVLPQVEKIKDLERDWLMVASAAHKPPQLKTLMLIVSARTGVGIYEMQSASRMPRIVRARMIFCATARKLTRWGTPEIGRKVSRDHSTVMHAISKVEAKTDYFEPEFSEILNAFGYFEGQEP
jgi:chromosomal replication initiation ATPase DnaA